MPVSDLSFRHGVVVGFAVASFLSWAFNRRRLYIVLI